MARAAFRDAGKLLSGNLLAKLFGVATLMLFTRILPKQQVAIFPAYLMMTGIGALFFSCGIYQTLVRKLPSLVREDPATARSLVVTGTATVMLGTIAVVLAALVFSDRIAVFVFRDANLAWAIRMMAAGLVAFAVARVADSIMWGRAQFTSMSALQIADSIARPLITVALFFWLGFPGIVYGLVLAQLVNAALLLYCVRDMFAGPLPRPYPIRRLIGESMPFYVDGYLWYLKGEGDSLLVTAFLGPVALAEYYVAKTLYSNIMLVLSSLDRVALERIARHAGLPDLFRAKATEMQSRIIETMVPLSLWVIALTPCAMVVIAGSRYENATWPAIGLLVVALVQFLVLTVDRVVFVALSGFYRLSKTAIEAAVMLLGSLLLVSPWGLMGIVGARLLAPLAGGAFGLAVVKKKLGLSVSFKAAARLIAVALPGTLVMLLAAPRLHGAASALLGGIVGSAVWAASFAAFLYALDRPFFGRILDGIRQSRSQDNARASGIAG